MSYSSLNDAFNINSNFENNIRGFNEFNPIKTNTNKFDFESNYFGQNQESNNSIINGMYSGDDNLSWESLNGTDLNSKKENQPQNKLTHRDCINIYNNPDSHNEAILFKALKHVSKCKDCKENIKNKTLSNEAIKTKNESNLKKKMNDDSNISLSSYRNFHNPKNSGSLNLSSQIQSLSNSKIESELKLLSDKINDETNLKYQNALIQNNISKYLEDLEEKKKINQKLDNIFELIKSEHNIKQENVNSTKNVDNNLMNIITSPQFLLNLSKINEHFNTNTNTNTTTTSFESYILYISIFIIMILLIIDIVLRLK